MYDFFCLAVHSNLGRRYRIFSSVIDKLYNNQGRLDAIPGIVNNINYNANGQMTLKSLASGKSTTLTYHLANQRLLGMTTPALQNLSYGYDNRGPS